MYCFCLQVILSPALCLTLQPLTNTSFLYLSCAGLKYVWVYVYLKQAHIYVYSLCFQAITFPALYCLLYNLLLKRLTFIFPAPKTPKRHCLPHELGSVSATQARL